MPVFLDTSKHKTAFGDFPEVSVDGWPEAHHAARPNDAIGAEIIAYAVRWRDHPNLPEAPFDRRTGRINLVPPDEPRAPTDEVPRYRLKETGFVGCNLYLAGQETAFPGWPVHPYNLEAVNESGRLVLDYMRTYGAGQKLPGAPHHDNKLDFPNPALRGSPITPTLRWSGSASAVA